MSVLHPMAHVRVPRAEQTACRRHRSAAGGDRSCDRPDRTIVDVCGLVELYVAEVDSWCALPVRLVQTAGAGLCLELGPYQLDAAGVAVLRAAVADYDLAVSGPAA